MQDLTGLIDAANRGEAGAEAALYARAYDEIRAIAAHSLRGTPPGATLQPTALANEAYLKLIGPDRTFVNRKHFFFCVARATRDVVVDAARRHGAQRRGGDRKRVDFDPDHFGSTDDAALIIDVHEALERLAEHDPVCADVVQLRFFGNHSLEETADLLGLSVSRVRKEWSFARGWLHRRLSKGET